MIHAVHAGIEIEMEFHRRAQGFWKCDYILIKYPGQAEAIHHGDREFPAMDLAKDYALQEAHYAIDQALQSKYAQNSDL